MTRHPRSRVCACRGCETHTGSCGWPTTNERRCDRCGRPGFANRFRRTPDHPVRRTSAVATAGEADGRGLGRASRLDLSGLASPAAPGATRRARGRPSGAARPRWRAAAGSAGRPLLELQRAQGPEPAAAVSRALTWAPGDASHETPQAPTCTVPISSPVVVSNPPTPSPSPGRRETRWQVARRRSARARPSR